ncbi:SGNH/GDSL hydrolase family protein [Tomitella biformata]|uniref:SGNH/GDSL hydrolase family protein n=1 Tax=Tomitella biformata TaxID=630403 RepID=UPI000467E9D5|nr:SGNH/GDSL hydrolase family protein [Tomitella biformata]
MQPRRVRSAILTAALVVVGAALVASPAAAEQPATYYVSMGDSLAAGYQPAGNARISYTDKIYAALKAGEPGLVHINFGCDGETSVTMVNGGKCTYEGAASQLDAAAQFVGAHRGEVKYVTNNIGANDIYRCVSGSTPDIGCIVTNLAAIQSNLATVDSGLRDAGGNDAVYVGMTYYNPMLASWLKGGTSRVIAAGTTAANNILTQTIALTNSANGWKTADVSEAFSNNDFTQVDLPGVGAVPKNVAQVCTWTWMCKLGDIHANDAGHQVIADTFLPLLTTDAPGGAAGSLGSFGALGALVG